MKSNILLYSTILTAIASTSTAYLFKPDRKDTPNSIVSRESSSIAQQQQQQQPQRNQAPIMPAATPPSSSSSSSSIIISDVLGKHRALNIFAGFTRDIDPVSSRLDSSSLNTTLLAPLNSALQSLPRKPWEDPQDYKAMGANAYVGEEGEQKARENLRRFVEAHVVTECPWEEGKRVKTMAGGEEVWWEAGDDGNRVVQPAGVVVEGVAERVRNGEVWILKGTLG